MNSKLKLLIFLLLGCQISLAQKTITGTVVDEESAEPLIGATVRVADTEIAAITGIEGDFILNDVPEGSTIIATYVSYQQKSITLEGQVELTIALSLDQQALDEVVVVGYGQERKVDVTGAISVVDLPELEGQTASSGNPMQAMQGRVPGLFIEKSGDPSGTNSRILIRGLTTLGNNNPLYVIDGIPTTRPEVFASLPPESIESVQVLKDASASSIYGSRAGNGVIVVTTRNGSRGEQLNISLNSNLSFQSENQQRYDMLNAQQRGQALFWASVNDGADPTGGYGEIYDFDWNGDFDNPVLNSVSVQPYVGGNQNVPAGNTDWQDVMYKQGIVNNQELSVSANSEKSSLSATVGYFNNTGMLEYTDYRRYNGRFNANTKLLNDKLRFGINSQFSTSNETLVSPDVGSAPTTGLAITLAPTLPVYDSAGDFAGPLGSGYSDRNNPLLMQYINRWDNGNKNTYFGNIFGEIQILNNLKFRSTLGIDYATFKGKNIETTVNNGFISRTNNRLINDENQYSSLVFSNVATYDLETGLSKFNVIGGIEYVDNNFDAVVSQADGFAVEQESYFVLGAASGARTTTGNSTGSSLYSTFGKMNYSFDERYLASFTLRRDGSSRFGSNNRYGVFPAGTFGWRIINEDFMQSVNWLSDLKLRAGYGEVGNQEIGDVARFGLYDSRYGPNLAQYAGGFFEVYYNIGTAYDINGNNTGTLPSGFVSIQAANPNLKWETTKEWNYGVDFGMLNDAITGSFDYYTRETSDILITPPIPSVVGEGQQRVLNGATTEAKGWEFTVGYDQFFNDDFSFGVRTNFGAFKDEITYLPDEVLAGYPGTAQNSILGQSQTAIFGYKTDGLFQSQAEVDAHPTGGVQTGNARPGGIRVVDLDGNGVINSNDRTWLGNTLPDLEYGLRIDGNYRDFDFSVFGSGVTGRIGLDPYVFWNNFTQGRENAGLGVLNAWTPENTNTTIPSLSLVNNLTETSDYLFRNNSYFKLRNAQLGYSLPTQLVNRLGGMQSLRAYVQGENLFWFTNDEYIGSDPERIDVNRIPVPTTLSLGLNINF